MVADALELEIVVVIAKLKSGLAQFLPDGSEYSGQFAVAFFVAPFLRQIRTRHVFGFQQQSVVNDSF